MDSAGLVEEMVPDTDEADAPAGSAPAKGGAMRAPLKLRLKAWWHGRELRPLGKGGEEHVAESAEAPAAPKLAPQPEPEATAPEAETVSESGSDDDPDTVSGEEAETETAKSLRVETAHWSTARIDVSQKVWGEGFASPGNENHIRNITKPLGLQSASTLMQIGAGFGGVSRVISQAYGCKVTAWDLDEALVSEAFQHQAKEGSNFKVSVFPLKLETFEAKEGQFDAALVQETLFLVEHKEHLLRRVVESLKPEGRIVLYDLIFEKATFPEPVAQWAKGEVGEVYPIAIDAMVEMLESMGIDVDVRQDESDLYSTMTLKDWAEFTDKIEKEPLDPGLSTALMREVEYWTRRINAIDSGWLKVYQISGTKASSENWS